MKDNQSYPDSNQNHLQSHQDQSVGPSLRSLLRYNFNALRIRFTSLWPEIEDFGRWVESTGKSYPDKLAQPLVVHIASDDKAQPAQPTSRDISFEPDKWPLLCNFLFQLGLTELRLDSRLERNQITDILVLLFTYRRRLQHPTTARPGSVPAQLVGPGLLFACTVTCLHRNVLRITYSYCLTRFSRIVVWFEQKQRDFSDHRALFRAAPKYGLIFAGVVVLILVAYSIFDVLWFRLALAAAGALLFFAITYILFMTIGSVEYDNEEKAYRLQSTYSRLRLYANRIQNDLARARDLQQKLIPDPSEMPLGDAVEWASSFIPEIEVGGDYFDVGQIGPHRAAILFSDVSGHGMSAALVTTIIKTAFQTWLEQPSPLEHFVRDLNRKLCRLTPDDSFAAVFLAILDTEKNELCYVNCGHHPEPLLIPAHPDQPVTSLSDAHSLILGVLEEIELEQADLSLAPGQILLMATDGIIESRNTDGDFFGPERLDTFLQARRGKPVKQIVDDLVKEVADFTRQTEQNDDQTILAFQIKSP